MPAALVAACCSAMPTSKVRSGNSAQNLSSPVGPIIAAVIATTSGRRRPISTSSAENTDVQVVPLVPSGWPVSGSRMPTAWKRSASSSSAGE